MPHTLVDMGEENSSREIATLEQSQILMDSKYYGIIRALWRQPCAAGELVSQLDLDMNTVHYRLRRLLKYKLAAVSHVEPRRGRPIKKYCMTSKNYIIPFAASSNDTIGEFFAEQINKQHAIFSRNFTRHMDIASQERKEPPYFQIKEREGAMVVQTDFLEDISFCISHWQNVWLNRETAREIEREIIEIISKYSSEVESENEEKYIVGFQSCPIIED